jgi:hypothetical protein
VIRFTRTRTRRHAALTVLTVWLFAIAASWANACVLQERSTHRHGSLDPQTLSVQMPTVSTGHLGADGDHPENAGAARSACLKFCGDGAQTLVKVTPGTDLLNLPMAPPLALAWTTRQAAAAHARAWLELPAPSPGLPLRTRFSRLAL